MLTTRQSSAVLRNENIVDEREPPAANGPFYSQYARAGSVLLLGGNNLLHFRLRVAQSHLRRDLLPSFWSLAGLVVSKTTFLTVPIGSPLQPESVPQTNAIHECAIADFDDPKRFPNIAILSFADRAGAIVDNARRLRGQRGAIDLPHLLVPWLAFAWGVGTAGNPLLQNLGMPSAGLIETAFGMAGIELTPGVSSATSCPEAIWQSALWWHDYYEKTASAQAASATAAPDTDNEAIAKRPEGRYVTRQPAAAVTTEEGAPRPAAPATRAPARRRKR
jgi:hypothetical protein